MKRKDKYHKLNVSKFTYIKLCLKMVLTRFKTMFHAPH